MSQAEPPKALRGRNLCQRLLKQKLWRPPNQLDNWAVFAMVGREGSGKSYTTMSMLYAADPTFSADRVFFEPQDFMEYVNELSKGERTGKAVMLDESGVGMGVRSWYEKDQIKFNQAMQTARDDNMIVGLTLPRLSELDSQLRGRLHGFCEMHDKAPGEWAEFSWKNYDPSRDEQDRIYKKYPRLRVKGRRQRLTRLRIGPPPAWLVEDYEAMKEEFKNDLYAEVIEEMDDGDGGDGTSPKAIADDIAENGLSEYVGRHSQNGTPFIKQNLIRAEYELSHSDADAVKALLERDIDDETLESLA